MSNPGSWWSEGNDIVASFSIPHLLQPLLLSTKSFSEKKQ
jgi:hypothetical protein